MEGQSSRTSSGDWIGLFHMPCLQEAAYGGRVCIQCYHQPRIFPAIHPPMKTHATSAPIRQSDLF